MLTNPVPEEVSQQVSDIADRAMQSEGELANTLREGTQGRGFIEHGESLPTQNAGMDNKALVKAIENRGLRKYRNSMAKMNVNIDTEALQMRMRRLNSAAQLVNAEHQQNERARMNKYLMEQNRKRARAGVLGNILGIAGAGAGAFAGGPAGAAAGYSLGQGVGQMAGQQGA